MLQKSREIIYAVIAMIFITLCYLLVQVVYGDVQSASSFWGHSIGVIGFLLMLMTETLYSMRKRSKRAVWGKMSDWLEFHIFTGLVGPFMVLLHPGWKFNGLAGVLTLLTILIVISGIIGRYIYTAVPRTADGVELDLLELKKQAEEIEAKLRGVNRIDTRRTNLPNMAYSSSLGVETPQNVNSAAAANRPVGTRNPSEIRDVKQTLHGLTKERDRLNRAIYKRQTARKLFSLWHAIHIPLGLTLFLIAFVHIGAAIYYAGLLK